MASKQLECAKVVQASKQLQCAHTTTVAEEMNRPFLKKQKLNNGSKENDKDAAAIAKWLAKMLRIREEVFQSRSKELDACVKELQSAFFCVENIVHARRKGLILRIDLPLMNDMHRKIFLSRLDEHCDESRRNEGH